MPENYIRRCKYCNIVIFYSSVLLKASWCFSSVVSLHVDTYTVHTHTIRWYCIRLMSIPICHRCSPCCTGSIDAFSPIIYLHWATRRSHIPSSFCLPRWKGITVLLCSDNNARSHRNISLVRRSACWEAFLSVPFIEVITDFMSQGQKKGDKGRPPTTITADSPKCVSWFFLCSFVVAFTCKFCSAQRNETS